MRTYLLVALVAFIGCSQHAGDGAATVSSASSKHEGTMPNYPLPANWEHANERQRQRAARSFTELARRKAPVYDGPLVVDDDDEAKLHSPQEVARRTLVLWAVELRAEGIPQEEALGLINQLDLWDSVSPDEKRFLQDKDPDPDECQELVWRLESIWVLLWSLGYIEELGWPEGMCDVAKIVDTLKEQEANPDFIKNAKLRSKAEILDAQDLTMRIHWAIRDAFLNHEGQIPPGLDWTDDEREHVSESPSVGVVEQRHHTLNWLVNYLDPEDWDSVDTPT